MSPNEMLQALSRIWLACVVEYPEADHGLILRHVEALQVLVFGIDGNAAKGGHHDGELRENNRPGGEEGP